jgi:hypothetical protein
VSPLEQVIRIAEIPDNWSMILIGDGSGSKWGYGTGWACLAFTKDSLRPSTFFGGANDGTVNVAELLPYFIPLQWYLSNKHKAGTTADVYIVSDSQSTVAAQTKDLAKASNAMLLAGLRWLPRVGVNLHWKFVERETLALNVTVDALSKHGRFAIEEKIKQLRSKKHE